MFKYNELSDLLDGTLVTPLSKTDDGSIRCIDSDGNECIHEFDDFDFDKTVEERTLSSDSLEDQISSIVEEESTESSTEETEEVKEESSISVDDLLAAMEEDDSTNDGTDDTSNVVVDENGNEVTIEDERFLNSDEVNEVCNAYDIEKDSNTKIRIWRDII